VPYSDSDFHKMLAAVLKRPYFTKCPLSDLPALCVAENLFSWQSL